MEQEIRKVKKADLPVLKEVLDSSELFPSSLLDDMISDYLTNVDSTDIWFTTLQGNRPISIGYCAPERLTDGTYNLYAIAVHKDCQGTGVGGQMMNYIEQVLREQGHRLLIVETSSLPEFELTRQFYHKCHYTQEAIIRDFYAKGDSKVIFWKELQTDQA